MLRSPNELGIRWLALALLAGSALSACGGEERAKDQWPIARKELEEGASAAANPGEATYNRYCIGCHGADGRGNGGITGANFTAADGPFATRTDAELLTSVRDGKRGATATMPAHGPVLTEAQIATVIAYVKQRFAPKGAAPAQPAAEAATTPPSAAPR